MTSYSTQKLSKMFNITGQTVRNAAKKLDIKPEKDKEGNGFIFNQDQAEKLAEHFKSSLETVDRDPVNPKKKIDDLYEDQIGILKDQIETLKEQIEEKDKLLTEQSKQISELISTNKALSASNAVQIASEKKEILLAENSTQETKKRGFWQRLFGE